MTQHVQLSEHLKRLTSEDGIRRTYLGQAHIAGTGPEGKTCRECAFWGVCKVKDGGARVIVSPGHYAASNKKQGGALKKGGCHRYTHRKANRRFTGEAMACRLFEQNETPPALQVEVPHK